MVSYETKRISTPLREQGASTGWQTLTTLAESKTEEKPLPVDRTLPTCRARLKTKKNTFTIKHKSESQRFRD